MNARFLFKSAFLKLAFPLVILALAALAAPERGSAQVLYGSIVGNVKDSTGATVPDAVVSIVQVETKRARQTTTNEAGGYTFATIPSGTYILKVSKEGFSPFTEKQVPVTINSVTRVDVTLKIGSVSQAVEVTAETALLQTDRSEVRAELTGMELRELPVPVRNYQSMFRMIPGFSVPTNEHSVPSNPSRALRYNVNGTSASSNNVRIDGASSYNIWLPHITAYVPPMEAIETVNVVTNSFDAEQGLAGGSAVNVQIKSGTNDFHGSAFEYHTDNALRARGFFLPTNQVKPKLVYNQFGGSIGGPIKKNKVFFFGDYEGTFDRRLADGRVSVPTLSMRNGDLTASPSRIFDPFTGNPDGSGKTEFTNKVIPSTSIDPIAQKILSFIPLPNLPVSGFVNDYYATGSYLFDRRAGDTKINWNTTSKLNIYGRFSMMHFDLHSPLAFGDMGPILGSGGNPGTGWGNTYSYTIAGNYLLTPHMIVDAHFGWTRMDTNSEQPDLDRNIGRDVLGIPGTNGTRRFEGGWPRFQFPNNSFATFGATEGYMPYYRSDPQYQYVANLGWIKGAHNIRLGMDLYRQHLNHTQPEHYTETQPASGGFRFDRGPTTIPGQTDSDYNAFASFLVGAPANRGRILQVPDIYHTRTWSYSFYARDQWQLNRKLTLTYGTRYEYFPYPTRDTRGVERYDFATNKMLVCGIGSVQEDCGVSVSTTMFAPRFGFAYRATDTFVVRGGYGITNDPFNIARSLRANVPVLLPFIQTGPNSRVPVGHLQDGIPQIVVPDFSSGVASIAGSLGLNTTSTDFVRGYIQSWNVTLQKEFWKNLVGSVGYVATRQVKALGLLEQNYGFPGGGKTSQVLWSAFQRDADTQLVAPIGNSHYDSLQATLERRFSNGLQLNASYTWGKGIGIYNVRESTDSPAIKIPAFYTLNRAVFGFDRTHSFNLAGIYELPFGRLKKGGHNGLSNALTSGWQLNWLFSSYTGLPFGVSASGTGLNAPKNSQRADQVKPNVQKLGGIGDTPFYDPTAFAPVTAARFGTAGFNALRGPGLVNLDFGLFRDFRMTERLHMQFRAEVLNFSNTPHFANPRSDVSGSKFMIVDNVVNSGREPSGDERAFRFGLRLGF